VGWGDDSRIGQQGGQGRLLDLGWGVEAHLKHPLQQFRLPAAEPSQNHFRSPMTSSDAETDSKHIIIIIIIIDKLGESSKEVDVVVTASISGKVKREEARQGATVRS
jgi:hypothetical protein